MTRHEARECALQALYQIDLSQSSVMEAIAFVVEDKPFTDKDIEYITRLTQGTIRRMEDEDEVLSIVMERWSPERIGRVEHSILRLALFELLEERDTAPATVVDEAVRLAKGFSSETSGKFVNGVLAKVLGHLQMQRTEPSDME